jgi:hypothetical protein
MIRLASALGLHNSHMRECLFAATTPRFGKASHTLPRSLIGSRLTASSSCACSTVVVAIRPVSVLRGIPCSHHSLFFYKRSSSVRPTLFIRLAKTHISRRRSFSSTSITMTATKIDGTAIAKAIRERLHAEIEQTQKTNPRYKPSLKIIQGVSSLSDRYLDTY